MIRHISPIAACLLIVVLAACQPAMQETDPEPTFTVAPTEAATLIEAVPVETAQPEIQPEVTASPAPTNDHATRTPAPTDVPTATAFDDGSDPLRPPEALPILTDELVFISNNQLWTWSPETRELRQLTSQGSYGLPSRSPDGEWIAFCYSTSGSLDDGALPCTLWLWNVNAGYVTLLADHPNGQTWYGRTMPTWSPDGGQIAWGEFIAGSETQTGSYNLVMYDFDTHAMSTIAPLDLGFQDGGIRIGGLSWGGGGILDVVSSYGYGETACGGPGNAQCLFQPGGEYTCTPVSEQYQYWAFWLNDDPQLALLNREGHWDILDTTTGSVTVTQNHLAKYSLMHPDTSLSMVWEVIPDATSVDYCAPYDEQVWIVSPTGQRISQISASILDSVVSPSGQSFAYLDINDKLTIWQDSTSETIPTPKRIQWLVWGPDAWWLSPLQ